MNLFRNKKQILFLHNNLTRFVAIDLDILADEFDVHELNQNRFTSNISSISSLVNGADLIFGWFASWHMVLPLMLSKMTSTPSILVIGGYDLANLSEIAYGHQRGGLPKLVSRLVMKMANLLITNSMYSYKEAVHNAGVSEEKLRLVYHGIPVSNDALPKTPKSRMAITVGNVNRSNLRRKGHEAFLRAASYLPDVRFKLIGNWHDSAINYLRGISTKNVDFPGWVDAATLNKFYGQASVYVQPSLHEGFGMSVAESMLGGCIPVISKKGALPEVVGEYGNYLSDLQPVTIANSIRGAMEVPVRIRREIRESIICRFPLEKRRNGLNYCINDLFW